MPEVAILVLFLSCGDDSSALAAVTRYISPDWINGSEREDILQALRYAAWQSKGWGRPSGHRV
jgi:hypothetical protein